MKTHLSWSLVIFFLAGICEVAGCWFIWQAVRGNRPLWMGIVGGLMLAGYGLIATQLPAGFGRTYAAYGGIFIILSLFWAWHIDKVRPDLFDFIGAAIVLAGASIIYFTPRN